MEKYVSKHANFVLYKPTGWTVSEGVQPKPGYWFCAVRDPSGMHEAHIYHGISPTGKDVFTLAKLFVQQIGRQYRDLRLPKAMISRDRRRIVFDGVYTDPQKGRREFRCWVSGGDGSFINSLVEAPAGRLAAAKPLLLTILSNVRVLKGAFRGGAAASVPLVTHRLRDGSASFQLPRGWRYQEFGRGHFVATDASGLGLFVVATAQFTNPQHPYRPRVNVPGMLWAPYSRPHRGLQLAAAAVGAGTNMQFRRVTPRQDLAAQAGYRGGPITVEEFEYTFVRRGRKYKGYTLGASCGTASGLTWSLFHLSVWAPLEQFDAFFPTFAAMLQSYTINPAFARVYIAKGLARLRVLQQQTMQMVARNAREIRETMQAAYDERRRSKEYIDYQTSRMIRGEQDWVSDVEGGTVYRTDRWGTRNLDTGERYKDRAYDYVNFEGRHPKYHERMTPINSRQLWERHFRPN